MPQCSEDALDLKKEAQMAPKNEYPVEQNGESMRPVAGVAEKSEELVGSIDRTMDSAAQSIQDTLQRTKKSARAAMGTVADGIEASTAYLTERGMEGMAVDIEALIRRYPFQALLIGSSVGFLLSRSWKR